MDSKSNGVISLNYTDPFLSDFVQDLLVLVGVLGVLLTGVALAITVVQLRKTKTVLQASSEANEKAIQFAKNRYREYVMSNAKMFLRELEMIVGNQKWNLSSSRANDLADQFAQFAIVNEGSNETTQKLVGSIRAWTHTFDQLDSEELEWDENLRKKWVAQIKSCYKCIDEKFGPFKPEVNDDGVE